MKRLLVLFAALSLFCCAHPLDAQDTGGYPSSVRIVSFTVEDGMFFTHYMDGSVTALNLSSLTSGPMQTSQYGRDADSERYQDPYGDVPKITTKWCDKKGAEHSVSTPIASTTKAGLARAQATHQALVTMMQKLYPPKKP